MALEHVFHMNMKDKYMNFNNKARVMLKVRWFVSFLAKCGEMVGIWAGSALGAPTLQC